MKPSIRRALATVAPCVLLQIACPPAQAQALTQCALDLGLGSGLSVTALTGLLDLAPNGPLAQCVTSYTT